MVAAGAILDTCFQATVPMHSERHENMACLERHLCNEQMCPSFDKYSVGCVQCGTCTVWGVHSVEPLKVETFTHTKGKHSYIYVLKNVYKLVKAAKIKCQK